MPGWTPAFHLMSPSEAVIGWRGAARCYLTGLRRDFVLRRLMGGVARGMVYISPSPTSTTTTTTFSSDLPVRLHRGVPVLAALLRGRHHHPEGRGRGDGGGGRVDRLQVAGAHRSPGQGKRRSPAPTAKVSKVLKSAPFSSLPRKTELTRQFPQYCRATRAQ